MDPLAGPIQDDAKQGLVSTLSDRELIAEAGCMELSLMHGRLGTAALVLETILGGGGLDKV